MSTRTEAAVITGTVFKLEANYHGRSHEWVAPQPAVHAISVLEALSSPHRLRSSRAELWLRSREHRLRTSEWQHECSAPLWIPRTMRINMQLARLGAWLELPPHEGKQWRLSTHQGRKTFARFVALRDRTSLFALAQHLGHRDRAITDTGYVGTDYALKRDIDTEVINQSVSAWEHMLSTPQLGGRAGSEILTKRPRFRGSSMKQDLKHYARTLVEAGLTLGVCDWGSASTARSTARVGAIHWVPMPHSASLQPAHDARILLSPTLIAPTGLTKHVGMKRSSTNRPCPRRPVKIARERLAEALAMLRSIDTASRTDHDDGNASR